MNGTEMIPCDKVIIQLWEYIDGELTDAAEEAVRRHLDMCARCFPQYDFQRAYKEFVRRTSTQGVPPTVRRRIFEALLEESGNGANGEGAEPARGLGARLRAALGSIFRRGGR